MNAFTIRDLENLSGVKAHTIRIWEQRYHFLKPKRSQTNFRYYDNEELKKLLNVALLNRYGFRISQIDKMDPQTIREKILSLHSSEAGHDRLINEMVQHMVDLNGPAFEELLDDYVMQQGIDRTINALVFPFLEKTGLLWQLDRVRIAQEHLVSNIIRQKLILGIENSSNLQIGDKSIVMYTPAMEYHELGLLYMHYQLKVRGATVIYLGCDVPVQELEAVMEWKKPNFAYTHLTSIPAKFIFSQYLSTLDKRLSSHSCVISGRLAQQYAGTPPKNVRLARSLRETLEILGV